MPATVNIVPTEESDGVLYANAVPLTSTEAVLNGGTGAVDEPEIPVSYGISVVAVVQLSINGVIVGNNTYVVLQTDLGDGVWIDVCWIVWTGAQGAATFVLAAGGSSANFSFQQTRDVGQPPTPQAAGNKAMPLCGRVRIVGKTIAVGGSSSLAGVTTSVSATIRYKLLGLR